MTRSRAHRRAGLVAALAAASLAAWAQDTTGSSASVTLGSGPHKGKYDFAPRPACVIAAFSDKPPSLSLVMSGKDSSLSIDVPRLDEAHASEIQVVLVVGEARQGAGGVSSTSTTYEIDTRPDESLAPFKRAERANKGMTGKATTILMTQGNSTLVTFSGETARGVKFSGEITCRRV